jgi:hypothetical protein
MSWGTSWLTGKTIGASQCLLSRHRQDRPRSLGPLSGLKVHNNVHNPEMAFIRHLTLSHILVELVEPRGVEPLTSSLRTRRSPN